MDRSTLAAQLVTADAAARASLLVHNAALIDGELARALKDLVYEAFGRDPGRAIETAGALDVVAAASAQPEILAYAAWTAGIAALLDGRIEDASGSLGRAAAQFDALGQPLTAAATQVSQLMALAILGRYDEALTTGLRARDVFVAHGDLLAAGKIEQNLGNAYYRREQYAEAEQLYRAARERYLALGELEQLTQVENNLANMLSLQHQFRAAEHMYEQALARAVAAGMEITAAEIECNLGIHALFQGKYDRALHLLEQARRRYAAFDLPHELATVELELADAYLELNLAPEAARLYERLIPVFVTRGMRAEQVRATAQYGRTLALLERTEQARATLAEARALYAAEDNRVGEAAIMLAEAQLDYAAGAFEAAATTAARAEESFAAAGAQGRLLVARWLRGAALRAAGDTDVARGLLEDTLTAAEQQAVPQIAQRCLTSLGLLAAQRGDRAGSEALFQRAVTRIEELRAPLPADEFRTAFIADKLTPYVELVRLCLADGSGTRVAEALGYVERARSRALLDMVGGALHERLRPRDEFEAALFRRLTELREELNWFYSQMNRAPDDDRSSHQRSVAALSVAACEREVALLELRRQLQQRSDTALPQVEPIAIAQLQADLGEHTALVEYFSIDHELLAFIVTGERIEVVRGLAREDQVAAAIQQLQFQMGALRYGKDRVRPYLEQLTQRAHHHLQQLYEGLLRVIEPRIGQRRLLVVPHRSLHYVPFHALYDGAHYVIERREVCYVPSAGVLRLCLDRPQRPRRSALLLGVPDAQTPRVRDEVLALAPLFTEATTLLDEQATLGALQARAAQADVLHLACHGQFRPDNPLFSSVRLADGWLTVRDAAVLDLQCELVTLSACETGLHRVVPGDELIGLARGFFAAGAPSLLVSLWMVDDAATATFMIDFYTELRAGAAPATALRHAQRALLAAEPHPFFWSPFMLLGRW